MAVFCDQNETVKLGRIQNAKMEGKVTFICGNVYDSQGSLGQLLYHAWFSGIISGISFQGQCPTLLLVLGLLYVFKWKPYAGCSRHDFNQSSIVVFFKIAYVVSFSLLIFLPLLSLHL